jgi:hypothetical protein
MHRFIAAFLAAAALFAQAPQAVLNRITPNSLKGDVSFLASDALEGRATPSRGQDIAAEFIASRFRAAGLEPAGDDGFFQTANMVLQKPNTNGASVTVTHSGKKIAAGADKIAAMTESGVNLTGAQLVKVDLKAKDLDTPALKGKVVAAVADFSGGGFRAIRQLQQSGAAMILFPGKSPRRQATARPIDPSRPKRTPIVFVDDDALRTLLNDLPAGPSAVTVDAKLPQPEETPVKLRNVVGILRGTDPALRDTFVLVSAHYDHLGTDPTLQGDTIYNGANDDASGTSSVIAVAQALAAMKNRPRRSIVFLALFGEELGLIGSRYYADHPLFPLQKTVAALNLEQTGRTDEEGGPALKRFRITGEDYSDVVKYLDQAGSLTGIKVEHEPRRSDEYFQRSDNLSFAEKGIPAHTICVAYTYSDYHGTGDHWDKIDYENMAAVTRAIAEGAYLIADSAEPPHWNRSNPQASKFLH